MGNFDMNSVFNENMKVSTYELAKELSNESNGKNEMADEIYKKLTNSHGSGLLDKLIKHFDFDMERIAGDSKRETFDILRILKQLYYIEKAGKKGKKIRIIDILAKPRLANIPFVDSRSGIYNDVFRKLYDQIKEAVPDAEERHAKLEQVDRLRKLFFFLYRIIRRKRGGIW